MLAASVHIHAQSAVSADDIRRSAVAERNRHLGPDHVFGNLNGDNPDNLAAFVLDRFGQKRSGVAVAGLVRFKVLELSVPRGSFGEGAFEGAGYAC